MAGGQGVAAGQGGQGDGHAAGCGAGAGAIDAQAASSRQAHNMIPCPIPCAIPGASDNRPFPMWVVLLEMGVALGLLVFIVWWTWPKKGGDE